jgi:hypothetical protein
MDGYAFEWVPEAHRMAGFDRSPNSVRMSVMDITHMGMGMFQRSMTMLMGMPEGAITGDVRQIIRSVRMVVVGVPSVGIVLVPMGMA